VTSDLDIYRTAKRLISEHGEQTPSMVATMICEFTDLEAPEAAAVWRRIGKAVEELLARKKPDGATIH
jgi:hypothetical protein